MKHVFIKVLSALCLVASSPHLNAQSGGIKGANQQLRQLFGNLNLPPNPNHFLYDMSAKMSDSSFYQTNCVDTLTSDMWFQIYEEMYHSAYDTTKWPKPDTVYTRSHRFYTDTIPMGLMNLRFYKLRAGALTSQTYFNWDTTNNVLTDKYPRPQSPYLDSNLFAAAPLVKESYFTTPVFLIDPEFIIKDNHNAILYGNEGILKIDFDDGKGFVKFNPNRISHHAVKYNSAGYKYIRTIVESATTGNTLYSSISQFYVLTNQAIVKPNSTISVPGLNVGVYNGCNGDVKSGKVVIYLSGFDILDMIPAASRSVEKIYSEMISNNRIVQLKNQGYSFIVVDYKNSRIDMRFNALYFLNLLEKLKCGLDMDHQFVIMGESMGGLIARYAMTYIESSFYDNQNTAPFFADAADQNNQLYLMQNPDIFNLPNQWCLTPKKHNTRLLITLDSPHQGANVPLSMQYAYNSVLKFLSRFIGMDAKYYTRAYNLFLDAQAAQQMLLYHADMQNGSLFDAMPEKYAFFNQLQQLGDYPKYAKVTALSNGSLKGELQTNYYTRQERVPGDRLVDLNAQIYCRILGRKFGLAGGEIDGRTNPNGYGSIFTGKAKLFTVTLKLYWIGIKFKVGYQTIYNNTVNANVKPYCTSPGGWTGEPTILSQNPSISQPSNRYTWMRYFFNYTNINTGMGCNTLGSHLGLYGIATGNFDFSICTDGLHFTIVPLQSALDYGTIGTVPLDKDIEAEGIVSKLNKVKPSVIIGYPDQGVHSNKNHTGSSKVPFRDINTHNLTQKPAPVYDDTYYSCIGYNDAVERCLLNMEIGDEELYLENAKLGWHSTYQTEYDIHVNERNPHYEYPSQPASGLKYHGIYSKENDFIIEQGGFASFMVDKSNSPTKIGLSYSPPHTGTYNVQDVPLQVCCINFIGSRLAEDPKGGVNKKEIANYVKLFPNPLAGPDLVIEYQLKSEDDIRFELINSSGQVELTEIFSGFGATLQSRKAISINRELSPGLYLVRLIQGRNSIAQQLIVTKE